MKILHINMNEKSGGAAVAANRLHTALREAGVDSQMGVLKKQSDAEHVINIGGKLSAQFTAPLTRFLERQPLRFYSRPEHPAYFTLSLFPSLQHRRINGIARDILHLHWITGGFISPWALSRLSSPVVWTMHDIWPFTGGCHYFPSKGCTAYERNCGFCPELRSGMAYDASRLHWFLKRKAVLRLNPVIISPSKYYAEKAAESGMLKNCRIENIPNCIDTTKFKPIPKTTSRKLLNLPAQKTLLLFGAANTDEYIKGFDLLSETIGSLPTEKKDDILVCVFGASHSDIYLPCQVRFLGQLRDDISIALAYSAADIFLCPSRQDNLPNTVMESLACGTPVVAFAVGGIPDMVEHETNGWLAKPEDARDMAKGIILLLDNIELRKKMGSSGRMKVEREFSFAKIASLHVKLYEELMLNGI